jgi:hypothetical protein
MKKIKEYTGDYLSLYDYLGHAAGGELGRKIAYEAAKCKVNIQNKKINNPTYTGRIQMYPKDFLSECVDKGLLS